MIRRADADVRRVSGGRVSALAHLIEALSAVGRYVERVLLCHIDITGIVVNNVERQAFALEDKLKALSPVPRHEGSVLVSGVQIPAHRITEYHRASDLFIGRDKFPVLAAVVRAIERGLFITAVIVNFSLARPVYNLASSEGLVIARHIPRDLRSEVAVSDNVHLNRPVERVPAVGRQVEPVLVERTRVAADYQHSVSVRRVDLNTRSGARSYTYRTWLPCHAAVL